MNKQNLTSIIGIVIIVVIGIGLGFSGSQHSITIGNHFPLFALMVGMAYIIQWLAFIPAYITQSERFFDITGSFTYISVAILSLNLASKYDLRSVVVAILVVIWAVRLGSFLFKRIHRSGKDERFDDIKPSIFRFLLTWTLQGLWVSLTVSAALAVLTSLYVKQLDIFFIIGAGVWLLGFGVEAIADAQKKHFKDNPDNKGKFIQSGLWGRSRHPNYFGEIVLWLGIAIIAVPVLQGWQWMTMVSPVFVFLLLTKISGIPLLEKKADDRWGGQEDYESYKRDTPVLIPRLMKK